MADFDRHLTSRGLKDPGLISKELMHQGIVPDMLFTSSAKRAVQTTDIFADYFQIPITNIIKADFLYGYYSSHKLIDFLQSNAANSDCVQIIGHNPKMEELGADLTGSVYRRIPTSGTMVFEFDVDSWDHISEGIGTLIHFIIAKPLRD